MEKGDHSSIIYGTHFPNRLFVGCLPPQATADDLGQFFSTYGKVVEAKVVLDEQRRSKRFGFVSFSKPEEAESVLASGDVHLMGKKINVGPAVKKEVKDNSPTVPVKIVTSTPVEETSSVDTYPASRLPVRKPKYKYSISNSSLNSDASYHTPPHSPIKGSGRSPSDEVTHFAAPVRVKEESPRHHRAGCMARHHRPASPPMAHQHRPATPPNAIMASQLEASSPPKCHSPSAHQGYRTPPQHQRSPAHQSAVYQQQGERRFDQGLLATVPSQQQEQLQRQQQEQHQRQQQDQLQRDMYNHTISPPPQHVQYQMEQQYQHQGPPPPPAAAQQMAYSSYSSYRQQPQAQVVSQGPQYGMASSPIHVAEHTQMHHNSPPQMHNSPPQQMHNSPPASPNSHQSGGYAQTVPSSVQYSTMSMPATYTMPTQAQTNAYQPHVQQLSQQHMQNNQSYFYIPWSSEYTDLPPQSPAYSIQSQYSLPSTPALPLPYMMMPTFAF